MGRWTTEVATRARPTGAYDGAASVTTTLLATGDPAAASTTSAPGRLPRTGRVVVGGHASRLGRGRAPAPAGAPSRGPRPRPRPTRLCAPRRRRRPRQPARPAPSRTARGQRRGELLGHRLHAVGRRTARAEHPHHQVEGAGGRHVALEHQCRTEMAEQVQDHDRRRPGTSGRRPIPGASGSQGRTRGGPRPYVHAHRSRRSSASRSRRGLGVAGVSNWKPATLTSTTLVRTLPPTLSEGEHHDPDPGRTRSRRTPGPPARLRPRPRPVRHPTSPSTDLSTDC